MKQCHRQQWRPRTPSTTQMLLHSSLFLLCFSLPLSASPSLSPSSSSSPSHPTNPIPFLFHRLRFPKTSFPQTQSKFSYRTSPYPSIMASSTTTGPPIPIPIPIPGSAATPIARFERPISSKPSKEQRTGSFAKRVFEVEEADLVFLPFFATLSAEMQLGLAKGVFRKKVGNQDYERQRKVVDFVKNTEAWKRSGGRDHVFVLTDPVAMWHVRAEIAPAIPLVVDFGGWYRLDSRSSGGNSSDMIQHIPVSLLKDVIVPYTHLLPRLLLSENKKRETLLYFKGAKHRHPGGLVREKMWDLLVDEPGIIMEEGFTNATGKEQSIRGMRSSEFCLHPAGDTPTSCRLFDAIQNLCIPVIVSDNIELPFKGMIDYAEFSVFVAVGDALKPKWLVSHLKSFSKLQRDGFRRKMSQVQPMFDYANGHLGGIGSITPDGTVNNIWKKVHQKLPMIKETIVRERRKPPGVSVPLRCHCT